MCCCTLSIFAIIVLVGMGFLVQSGDPYIGGHKLVATEEVRNQSPVPEWSLGMLRPVTLKAAALITPSGANSFFYG